MISSGPVADLAHNAVVLQGVGVIVGVTEGVGVIVGVTEGVGVIVGVKEGVNGTDGVTDDDGVTGDGVGLGNSIGISNRNNPPSREFSEPAVRYYSEKPGLINRSSLIRPIGERY
jgi:hypothetical protein